MVVAFLGVTVLFLALSAGARALGARLAPVPTDEVRDPAPGEVTEPRAAQ